MRSDFSVDGTEGGRLALLPDRYRAPASVRGVVFCHALLLSAHNGLAVDGSAPLLRAITEQGVPVVYNDLAGDSWGNATAVTRAGQAKAYGQGVWGFKGGTIHLLAVSHGCVVALNYAKANPAAVASLALILPPPDIQAIYDEDRATLRASIGAAHGGRPADANNPADNVASFGAIPTKIWYSTDDAICLPAEVTGFAAAIGAQLRSLGAVGHSATSVDPLEVATFLGANA